MTLLYRVVPAHLYISICVAAWGLIASLQCVTGSFASMLILRGLLGVAEAAFGPGVPFYLSFFFKREELALRTGLFISAAPLATSFASSLAWVITKAGEGGPISAWRLLFLIEGFPSIIVAAFAFYHIPDGPATAKFLTKRQKKVARLRLTRERGPKHTSEHSAKLDFRDILQTLIDPKCYITAVRMQDPTISSEAKS
jgi:MFS family permease